MSKKAYTKMCAKKLRYLEFNSFIKSIMEEKIIHEMKNYIQHGSTTCFQHCVNVAYYNYRICRMLGFDSKSAARAGMLHDFFLYDWHKMKDGRKTHGFTHPKVALENAKIHFPINEREADIILKHMFPLTFKLPKYKETIVIVLVDKYCTIIETIYPRLILLKQKLLSIYPRRSKF